MLLMHEVLPNVTRSQLTEMTNSQLQSKPHVSVFRRCKWQATNTFFHKKILYFHCFPCDSSAYLRIGKSELKRGPTSDTKMKSMWVFFPDQRGMHSSCFFHFLIHFIFAYLKSRGPSGMEAGVRLQLWAEQHHQTAVGTHTLFFWSSTPHRGHKPPTQTARWCRQGPGGTAAMNSGWSTPSSLGTLCSMGDNRSRWKPTEGRQKGQRTWKNRSYHPA